MGNQSSAYDFALFEPKRIPEKEPERQSNVIRIPKEKLEENRRPKPNLWRFVPTFLAFLLISGMVGFYIYGQAQLSQLSESMSAAQKTLDEQENRYTQLKIRSDSVLSMEAVETYASDTLGMKKTTQDQVTSVSLSEGDKTEVVSESGGTSWFERAWEKLMGFLS